MNEDNFILDRLEFIVTNNCNLSCEYCYANSGSYNQKRMIISDDVIDKTYLFLKESNIIQINQIIFFGGEPLLCIDKIGNICEMFNSFSDETPKYFMVSNFTILNENIIDVIKKYNINVTVSIDGPKFINDTQRKFVNCNESVFDVVSNNINECYKNNIKINSIESTYTKCTSEKFTRYQLAKYFFNKFKNIDIIQICNEKYNSKSLNGEDLTFIRGLDFSEEDLINLRKKRTIEKKLKSNSKFTNVCKPFIKNLSIFPNGDIYPCHLFANGNKGISNVKQNKVSIINDINKFKEQFDIWMNKTFNNCNECEGLEECSICTGLIRYTISEYGYEFSLVNEINCL